MMLAVQFTPTTPRVLLPAAPMVPDTCVPWPLSSRGSQVLVIALKPCVPAAQVIVRPAIVTVKDVGADQTFALRSACVYSMPVSTTATTFASDPVDTSQADLAPMSAPGIPGAPTT